MTHPYQWRTLLGVGSSGEVWGAERDGAPIAVKVLKWVSNPAHAEALRREMRLGPMLAGHPNIVSIHRVVEVEGVLHLEMDWVRGPSLADVIDYWEQNNLEPLPPSVVIPWMVDVLRALDWAGRTVAPAKPSSFVHRDIKPANLMLTQKGVVRITDFGIARAEAELDFQATAAGVVKGSPRYMAPEILEESRVDARCDQFSLGSVLYRLLAGEPLYRSKELGATLLEALEAKVQPRIDAYGGPVRIRKILRTLLSKNPDHRFMNHRVAADTLAALRLSGPTLAEMLPLLMKATPPLVSNTEGPEVSRAANTAMPLVLDEPSGTGERSLAIDTLDAPSLELDISLPPQEPLDLSLDSDTRPLVPDADTQPIPRIGPSDDLLLSADLVDALADTGSDRGGVTAPIARPEDEEETVLASKADLEKQLAKLAMPISDEPTVASEFGDSDSSTTARLPELSDTITDSVAQRGRPLEPDTSPIPTPPPISAPPPIVAPAPAEPEQAEEPGTASLDGTIEGSWRPPRRVLVAAGCLVFAFVAASAVLVSMVAMRAWL